MEQVERITHDPHVMGGQACIRGMPVTVDSVVEMLAAGHSVDQVLQTNAGLEEEDLRAAVAFAAGRAEAGGQAFGPEHAPGREPVYAQPVPTRGLLGVLFNRRPSLGWYVLRVGVISVIPSYAIGMVLIPMLSLVGLDPEALGPDFGHMSPEIFFVQAVLVAPLIETLLLSLTIWLLSFLIAKPVPLAVGAAVVWAVLHSLAAPIWGLVIVWPFFVFSCAYLAWRPVSWGSAIAAATLVHMFQNFWPSLLVFFQ